MTKIYRFSFSVLYPWSNGQYEEALNRYLKIGEIETPQMREGKLLHEQWRTETEKTGKLPTVFGDVELQNPECEVKMECMIDEWIQFVGVIDLLEKHRITDYKTGNSNSLSYISTPQLRCYQLLCVENGYVPTEAYIRHWNQYTKTVTNSKMYLSQYTLENARDWIITYASEMREAIDKLEVQNDR